jgi:hypothetical protein
VIVPGPQSASDSCRFLLVSAHRNSTNPRSAWTAVAGARGNTTPHEGAALPTLPTGVIGPLSQPAHPAGITFSTCTHRAPDSCRYCDGTADEDREYWSDDTSKEDRRAYLRGLREWHIAFHSKPNTEGNVA